MSCCLLTSVTAASQGLAWCAVPWVAADLFGCWGEKGHPVFIGPMKGRSPISLDTGSGLFLLDGLSGCHTLALSKSPSWPQSLPNFT